MPNCNNMTTEKELSRAVALYLSSLPTGEAQFSDIIAAIPSLITLTAGDKRNSTTREGEEIWEQRVRNIKSHKNANGNFINEGIFYEINGGLGITAQGRSIAA